jgi:rubrerythrin
MAKIRNQNKEKIISDFEMMREFELSLKDLYLRIVGSPDVKEQKIKDILTKIADDEQRHSELVQKIINIATNAL